jgi:hypothetical protein
MNFVVKLLTSQQVHGGTDKKIASGDIGRSGSPKPQHIQPIASTSPTSAIKRSWTSI